MIQSLVGNSGTTINLSLAAEVLGEDFEVWTFDRQWRRTSPESSAAAVSPRGAQRLIELLNSVTSRSRAVFESFDDRRTACLVAVPESHRPTVAIRIIDSASPEILQIATRASHVAVESQQRQSSMQRRLYESESQLATFSNRINRGNMEVSWLRDLATHAELQQRNNDPIRVAQKILPGMCEVICARTVIYIAEPTECTLNGLPMNAWQFGDTVVPDAVCLSLLKRHGRDAISGPAIVSHSSPAYSSKGFAGVLSAIVAAVRRDDVNAGWLLAVNKDLRHLTTSNEGTMSAAAVDRNCEFGEFEAGLMGAAANALATHARNGQVLESRNSIVSGTIRSLVNAIDAKDHYTCGHSDRVAEYARQIAATMSLGEEFCERIYLTGLLHDVGKIGVPDDVLQKPGRLTDDEFRKIQEHPVIGHDILKELAVFDYVLPGVLHHHEAVDGSGYPHGLRGDEIPLDARILAVADAYDAMTSDRPYRDGMSSVRAEAIIADGAGTQWDSECVIAFQRCIDGIRLIGHQPHGPSRPRFSPQQL